MQNPLKKIFKPRLKLVKGTRLTSFLFIGTSIVIAAGILFAANIYYNIDTGEVVVEHVERVTDVVKAIGGLVAGSDTLTAGYKLEVVGESRLATTTIHSGNVLRLYNPGNTAFVGFVATSSLTEDIVYKWPGKPEGTGYALTSDTAGNLTWTQVGGSGGIGDITAVGDCASGDCFTGANENYTLTFKRGTVYGDLTLASGGSNATYTLPAVSAGNYYFALTSGDLGGGNRITFASGEYTLGSSDNLTWDSGNNAIVVGASGVRGQLRLYSGNASNLMTFTPTTTLAASVTYTWPGAPGSSGQVLSSDTSGNLYWQAAATGDITAVGDCASGDCFTSTSTSGQNLWFYTGGGARVKLTAASTDSEKTITLPAADGTVALGTGSADAVAYWTGTNTLGYEAQLATTRGGTGQNSSNWTGMVRVSSGTWSAYTGTANYAAMWSSDGSYIIATATLPVSAGGTGKSSWTQWGVLYADSSTSLNNTAAGNTYQILTANTGAAPSWRNISDLITATNGVTTTGTTQLTLKLGGTLSEDTTISLGNYSMIFNMTGTGDFKVQDAGSDVFVVSDDGKVLFKGTGSDYYPIAQTGKQILREVVPIFGFDLPAKTATTSYVKVSRDIVNYPLNACEAGTSRVHKLVIRYGATATSSWQVATSTGAYTAFQLPPTTATSTGSVYTAATTIPTPSGICTGWNQGTDTDDWWVQTKLDASGEIMIYQIFLAAYDQIL